MPIPGDQLKNMIFRGGNLMWRMVKDTTVGYKAKAGSIKLTDVEADKFGAFTGVGRANVQGLEVAREFKNSAYVDQNNLEAFYLSKGKSFREGDELSLSGLDAIKSRYMYKYSNKDELMPGSSSHLVLQDSLDIAAATAAAVVGLKVTQAGVSLLTGD